MKVYSFPCRFSLSLARCSKTAKFLLVVRRWGGKGGGDNGEYVVLLMLLFARLLACCERMFGHCGKLAFMANFAFNVWVKSNKLYSRIIATFRIKHMLNECDMNRGNVLNVYADDCSFRFVSRTAQHRLMNADCGSAADCCSTPTRL